MEYGLIGEKLGHSFSGEIHRLIGDYDYRLCELAPDELSAFMQKHDFKGINVTIPYKTAVIPFLDEIAPQAAAIGAVNTVVNRGGRLIGFNTDYDGLKRLILNVTGGRLPTGEILILGTGGTSLTAAAILRDLGAGRVFRVSRTEKDGALSYERARRDHRGAGMILNTTPVGMYPNDGNVPIDIDAFPALGAVVDVIYHPLRTRLVRAAMARGIPAAGGLSMLTAQAVAAYGHFFDTVPDEGLADRIADRLTMEKENIVLIGMPASGKTSVGCCLAETLGRPFYDTDKEIENETGRPPSDILRTEGEPAFREIESRVIARLASALSGAVLATGGGAILKRENVDRLRANGRLFWLDRPLAMLTPTSDRPLSSDREALVRLYEEREPRYRASADETVPSVDAPDAVAARIAARYRT